MKDSAAKFTGQMYQLRHRTQLHRGAYVAINGPWDTYGRILSAEQQSNGEYLHQIRGVKAVPGEKPVAQF